MKITRAIEKIVKGEFEKRDVRMAETVKETVTEAVAEAVAESEALPVAIPEAEALQSLIAQDELAASQASQEVAQEVAAQEVTEAIEEAAQEVAQEVAQEAVKEVAQEVAAKPRVPDWVDLTKRVAVRNLEPLKVSLDLQYVQDSGVCEQPLSDLYVQLSTFVPEWTSIFQESIQDIFHKKATNFNFTRPDPNFVGHLTFDVLNTDKYLIKNGKTKHQRPVKESELMEFVVNFPLESTVYEGTNNGWVIPAGGLSLKNAGPRCGRMQYTNVTVQ